jgi:hypothetical protein
MPNLLNMISIVGFLLPYLALSTRKILISYEADDWPEMLFRTAIAVFVSWVGITRWLVQGFGLYKLPQDHFVLNILLSDITAVVMIVMLPVGWFYYHYDRTVSGDSMEAVHLVESVKRKVVSNKAVLVTYRLLILTFFLRVLILRIVTFYLGGFGNLPQNSKLYNFLVGDEIFAFFSVTLSVSYIFYLFINQYVVAKREALYN